MTTKVLIVHCGPPHNNIEVVEFTEFQEAGKQSPSRIHQQTTVLVPGGHREVLVYGGRGFEVRELKS